MDRGHKLYGGVTLEQVERWYRAFHQKWDDNEALRAVQGWANDQDLSTESVDLVVRLRRIRLESGITATALLLRAQEAVACYLLAETQDPPYVLPSWDALTKETPEHG